MNLKQRYFLYYFESFIDSLAWADFLIKPRKVNEKINFRVLLDVREIARDKQYTKVYFLGKLHEVMKYTLKNATFDTPKVLMTAWVWLRYKS